jgi:hypothetical protein
MREIIRIALLWILPIAVIILFSGSADKQRRAAALREGRIEFTPNRRAYFLWPALVAYLIYAAGEQLRHSHWYLFDTVGTVGVVTVTVMIIGEFPATIAVTADGLEQIYWFRRNKRIGWREIVEINTGEKSRTVTITGADGTKIVHSRQLADRPRLLMEIKQYCGENLPPDFPRESIGA